MDMGFYITGTVKYFMPSKFKIIIAVLTNIVSLFMVNGRALGVVIDGEIKTVIAFNGANRIMVRLHFQQFFGIHNHLIGVNGRGGGNGLGNDLALGQQVLHPHLNQARAILVKHQNPKHQRDQPNRIIGNDAAGQGGEFVVEAEITH